MRIVSLVCLIGLLMPVDSFAFRGMTGGAETFLQIYDARTRAFVMDEQARTGEALCVFHDQRGDNFVNEDGEPLCWTLVPGGPFGSMNFGLLTYEELLRLRTGLTDVTIDSDVGYDQETDCYKIRFNW